MRTVTPCEMVPMSALSTGTEQTVGEDLVITRWRVHLPATAGIASVDRWEYGGEVYEVDGEVTAVRTRGVQRKKTVVVRKAERV